LSILALVTIGFIALLIFQPIVLVVIGGPIFGFGHPLNPPELAEGAKFDWLHGMPQERQWTGILRRKFRVGTRTATFLTTLQQQGFEIDRRHRTASYEWGGMPCLYTLTVDWAAAKDTLTSVGGGYGSACL
jgi:hypothetical protein